MLLCNLSCYLATRRRGIKVKDAEGQRVILLLTMQATAPMGVLTRPSCVRKMAGPMKPICG